MKGFGVCWLILLLVSSLGVAQAQESVAKYDVVVAGKGALTNGADKARTEALFDALVGASYQRKALVSGVTEIENLSVSQDKSVIRTSSLISEYAVLDEEQVGDYLQVQVGVNFADEEPDHSVQDLRGYKVGVSLVPKGEVPAGAVALDGEIEAEMLKSFEQMYRMVPSAYADADLKYKLTYTFELSDSFFGLMDPVYIFEFFVTGDLFGSELKSRSIGLVEVDTSKGPEDEIRKVAADLVARHLMPMVDELSEQVTSVVNLEGDKLFLRAHGLHAGGYVEVIFGDLASGEEVRIPGVVTSVYSGEALVMLQSMPAPSLRIRKVALIAM